MTTALTASTSSTASTRPAVLPAPAEAVEATEAVLRALAAAQWPDGSPLVDVAPEVLRDRLVPHLLAALNPHPIERSNAMNPPDPSNPADHAADSQPDRIADQLIAELSARGVPADRYTAGPGSAGVNVWAPSAAITDEDPTLNRYPQASVLVSDAGKFHDVSWGANWEHVLPLNTPAAAIAAAVIKTLPDAVTRVLDQRS